MRCCLIVSFIVVIALLAAPAILADDVSSADKLICSAVEATVCTLENSCEVGAPWLWDIPQFIEVDLRDRRLSSTPASGENRSTPIKSLERADGRIFIQGFENGRAFSFVISEETGMLSAAVARDGVTVSVFGACTSLAR